MALALRGPQHQPALLELRHGKARLSQATGKRPAFCRRVAQPEAPDYLIAEPAIREIRSRRATLCRAAQLLREELGGHFVDFVKRGPIPGVGIEGLVARGLPQGDAHL